MISLNTISYYSYKYGSYFLSLLIFILGSVGFISILSLYFKRIAENNLVKGGIAIYQSKDISMQEKEFQVIDFLIGEKIPLLLKISLLFLIIKIPLFKLFGIEYFL